MSIIDGVLTQGGSVAPVSGADSLPITARAGIFSAVAGWFDGLGGGTGLQTVRAEMYGEDTLSNFSLLDSTEVVTVASGTGARIITLPFTKGWRWAGGTVYVQLIAGSASAPIARVFGSNVVIGHPRFRPSLFTSMSAIPTDALVPDEEVASLGWQTAQRRLAGPVLSGTRRAATVEWHHTSLDSHEGAFALVQEGGPLEELVGDVVRVSYGKQSAYAYVVDASDELDADVSLARRAFLQLTGLATDEAQMTVEVVSSATTG